MAKGFGDAMAVDRGLGKQKGKRVYRLTCNAPGTPRPINQKTD